MCRVPPYTIFAARRFVLGALVLGALTPCSIRDFLASTARPDRNPFAEAPIERLVLIFGDNDGLRLFLEHTSTDISLATDQ